MRENEKVSNKINFTEGMNLYNCTNRLGQIFRMKKTGFGSCKICRRP